MVSSLIFFSLVVILLYYLKKYINGSFTNLRLNMSNKIVIITGSSSGLGKFSAFQLLKDGAEVIFACRNPTKTENVLKELDKFRDKSMKNRAHFLKCDLTSFESVILFVEEFKNKFKKLDILINNAGVFPPAWLELSIDKLDPVIQSNHLSHMLLTFLLLKYFDKEEGKVINVSSIAYKISDYSIDRVNKIFEREKIETYQNYYKNLIGRFIHYGNTKLSQIYFSQYLGDYLEKYFPNIKITSIHPEVY